MTQAQAIKDHFDTLDLNGDGFLEKSDLMKFSEDLARAFGHSPSSPEVRRFNQTCDRLWQQMQSAVDKDQDQRITKNEYVEFQKNITQEQLSEVADAYADFIFGIADSDDNQRLTKDEYSKIRSTSGESRGCRTRRKSSATTTPMVMAF